MWPRRQGAVVSRRASTQPKQRKSPHEINRSVHGHRDTRTGPVDISRSAKLSDAHYTSCIQASHVVGRIQIGHVIHGSYVKQLLHRIGITLCED
jgi:hypothetical protein